MFVQWEDRIFSVLGDCSFLAARFCYCYLIFYYVWAEPRLIVLLSKIMGGGGGCDAMIFAAANANFLANSGFWYLFWMLICVDAFYMRKPGKIPYVLVFNLRVPPRVGANRHVCITAFCLRC